MMKRRLALLGAVAVLMTAGLSGSALASPPESAGLPTCEAVAIKLEDASAVPAARVADIAEAGQRVEIAETVETVRLDDAEVIREARPALPMIDGEIPVPAGKAVTVTCLAR